MSSTLTGSTPRVGILVRFEFASGTMRLWVGFGDLPIAAALNSLDIGDETFQGLGALAGIPDELQQLVNGQAGRGDFSLSGVSAAVAALAEMDAADIQGAPVNIGVIEFDDEWALAGEALWCWDGTADVLRLSLDGVVDGNQSYTLTLSVGSGPSDRARPDFANWTDAQHQKVKPGDLFLNHVPTQEKTKRWPGG